MIDKQLRILIVDALHAHVLQIEKMLNRMGYYAIATAGSATEAAKLSRAGMAPFDVLLAADHLVRRPETGGSWFEVYGIENAFIYSRPADSQHVHFVRHGEHYWRYGLPEFLMLEWFMARSKRKAPEVFADGPAAPCYFALPVDHCGRGFAPDSGASVN